MNRKTMEIGVLALQGDVIEHLKILKKAAPGAVVKEVKKAWEIETLDGLVIPGGESTTMGKLMVRYGIDTAIKDNKKMAVFGTCAGAILLAKEVVGEKPHLCLFDMSIERNAYGRQVESFEVDLDIPVLGERAYHAVFIRAPIIREVGKGVEVLARQNGNPVLLRQGRLLVATFHPELTRDLRLHRYFAGMAGLEES
jgi:5'-phosphate synthase pdxT subunit